MSFVVQRVLMFQFLAAETIPDLPPPTFEEAVAILNATTTGGETTRRRIGGPSGSRAVCDALVDSVSPGTRTGSPPTIDVEIASDSDSTSSSLFVVETPSRESARAQQWEEDRMAGVFTLEERVRRELERRSRQSSLPSPPDGISSANRSKGKEVLFSSGEDGTLQGTSRKGKGRATLGDSCPSPPSRSVAHDWVFVDASKSAHSKNFATSSRTTTSGAEIDTSGCVVPKLVRMTRLLALWRYYRTFRSQLSLPTMGHSFLRLLASLPTRI